MLLMQIYITGNNKIYVRLHENCPMLPWNETFSWPTLEVEYDLTVHNDK